MPKTVNLCLKVLIEGAGFPSYERFAETVNHHAWHRNGVRLGYDRSSVKRWLDGAACQYPDVVADVLSAAWGIPMPVGVIWPELRGGAAPVPAHLQAWVPARTLEDLAAFVRSDMLTRREVLTDAVGVVAGTSLVDPLTRWLSFGPVGIDARDHGTERIGMSTVHDLEQISRQLGASDAQSGGGLLREAAVGTLKRAVDLVQHASYDQATGQQMLAAIAELAGRVGWMSYDVGMLGPAQRYLIYALQAARESGHDRARLSSVCSLLDMNHLMRWVGRPDTAVRFADLAFDQLPADRNRYNDIRALIWAYKGKALATMGAGYTSEACSAVSLAFDLRAKAGDEDPDPLFQEFFLYHSSSDAELIGDAADCYRALARYEPRYAAAAETHARNALAARDVSRFTRSQAFDHIGLAQTRILQGEPEQACADARPALDLAGQLSSTRVTARLRDLHTDLTPHADQPAVRDFCDELYHTLTAA